MPYLSSTKYGNDKKINSQIAKNYSPSPFGSKNSSSSPIVHTSTSTTVNTNTTSDVDSSTAVLQMLTETKSVTGKHVLGQTDELRRRSWAASGGKNGILVEGSPKNRTCGQGVLDPAQSGRRRSREEAGELDEGFREEFIRVERQREKECSEEPSERVARVSEGEGTTAGEGGSLDVSREEEEMERHLRGEYKNPVGGRKSISGGRRRASLDYTDLEAVKERVLQASNLWALVDEKGKEMNEVEGEPLPVGQGEDSGPDILNAENAKQESSQEKGSRKVSLVRKWLAFGK